MSMVMRAVNVDLIQKSLTNSTRNVNLVSHEEEKKHMARTELMKRVLETKMETDEPVPAVPSVMCTVSETDDSWLVAIPKSLPFDALQELKRGKTRTQFVYVRLTTTEALVCELFGEDETGQRVATKLVSKPLEAELLFKVG